MSRDWDDDPTFVDAIEGYPSQLSYQPGDEAVLHVSTEAETFSVVVERWGAARVEVYRRERVPGRFTPPPPDADAEGCGWPESLSIPIGEAWAGGFHLVTLIADGVEPERATAHAGFVVRPASRPVAEPVDGLLVLATNTWNAYNTWGGRSLYTGGHQVSFARPMSRGALWREPTERDDRKSRPTRWGEEPDVDGHRFQAYRRALRYPPMIGSSGWYLHERRFVEWAEGAGYRFDYATSGDLERDPTLVEGYDLVIGVGHDEYWSAAQRDAVEGHVGRGGRYVSMSGNTMFWQVRLTDGANGGQAMICHKYTALDVDPIRAERPDLVTGMWADPMIGRPESALLGGGSAWGLYNRFGRAVRRGAGAFTVYRYDHWLMAGTDLGYGDLLGATHGVVGYETLGCRIQFDEFQQPVRAGGDGTPPDMEIVAFSPASNCGVGEYPASISALSDQGDLEFIARRIHGDLSPESLAKARHGTAIVAVVRPFGPEGGEVVTIGSTDWVFGLPDDPAVVQVTVNALNGGSATDGAEG